MGKKDNSEAVKCILRLRPKNQREINEEGKEIVRLDFSNQSVTVEDESLSRNQWSFDAVYNNTFSQKDIFMQSISPLVNRTLQGFNCTVFAYGQSGTGKTWSTLGSTTKPELYGIGPNALVHIFEYVAREQSDNLELQVLVSFAELYMGKCRDLLRGDDQQHVQLELRENTNKQFYVKDLTIHNITNAETGIRLLNEGSGRREVKSTKLNNDSSRSHSVFTVYIRRHDKIQDTRSESKFLLVDLAGSERQSKTEAEGTALMEGANINQSLTALGTVIDCLVKQKPHIPYRSSPLTMLLKDGLGGNSMTCILGTLSPSSTNVQETVSTIRFVDRAKQIKNKPTLQMDPKDAKIHELTEENRQLKLRFGLINEAGEELEQSGGAGGTGGGGDDDSGGGNESVARLRYAKSFEGEIQALKARVEELEVELAEAKDGAQNRDEEIEMAVSKFKKERDEIARQLQEAKDETQRVLDRMQLEQSVGGGSIAEQLQELRRLCCSFIGSVDKDKKLNISKETSATATVEDIGNAFHLIENNLALSGGGGGSSSNVLLGAAGGGVSPSASSYDSNVPLGRRRSFAGKGTLISPSNSPGGQQQQQQQHQSQQEQVHQTPPRKRSTTALSEATAVDGGKLPEEQIKEFVKNFIATSGAGGSAAAVVGGAAAADNGASGSAANSPTSAPKKELREALEDLLLKQRLAVHRAMFDVLKKEQQQSSPTPQQQQQGGQQQGDDVERSVLAAYDHANDEIERLTETVVKQKQLASKAKQIADKRAAEVEQLKVQLAQLKEEAVAKHARHAAEIEEVQSNLVASNNKKMEKLMLKAQKELQAAEKKIRDAMQQKLDIAEQERAEALNKYDVLVMEYENLCEAHEAQKIESLKILRSARGNGASQGSSTNMDDTLFSQPGGGSSHPSSRQARDQARVEKLRNDVNRAQNYSQATPTGTPRLNSITSATFGGGAPPAMSSGSGGGTSLPPVLSANPAARVHNDLPPIVGGLMPPSGRR